MPGEEPAPVLQDAFDALGTSLEEMIEICESAIIPADIMDQAKGQSSDWTEGDISAELATQCAELLPGLLDEKRAADEVAAEEEEPEKKKAAAAEKKKKEEKREEKNPEDKEKAAAAEKKKKEEKEKKEAAAAQKKKEDEQKAKEKAKREEEDKKKKQAAAEKKAADDKKRKEEDERKKAEQKKKDNAEKAKQQAAAKKKKEDDEKKRKAAAEQKKKEDEQKKKEKEAADKKKEAEKAKEKAAAAKKKQNEEEKKKEEDEEKKKKKGGAAKKEGKKEEKKQNKKENNQKQQQQSKKGARKDDNSEEEWDEEQGKMVQKKVPKNHRSKVADPGCGCTEAGGNGCRATSFIVYFLVFPALFAGLVFMEYESHGWVRVMDRSAAKNPDCFPNGPDGPKLDLPQCDDDDDNSGMARRFLMAAPEDDKAEALSLLINGAPPKPTEPPKPAEQPPSQPSEPSPTEPPLSKSKAFAGFVQEHPYSWILPLVGLAMGLFNNILPIAGGLVLMPFFDEMEITKTSDETLALACMAQVVNSGVLGFVSWCARDVRLFVCRALFMLVPIAWFGYLVGTTNNLSFKDLLIAMDKEVDDPGFRDTISKSDIELLHTYIRLGFGAFMCVMSVFVFIGCCIGGMNRYCCPSHTGGTTPGCKSFCQWIIVWALTFNTGWLLVANIGAGMGMTTFFLLSIFLGVEHKRAMPTAIVCGAWTAILPAFSNWFALGGGTYVRLMMMTPGMWLGALLAPWFSKCGGPMCDLIMFFFAIALCGVAVTTFAAIRLQAGNEDVDIDINPIYHVAFIDEMFKKERSEA